MKSYSSEKKRRYSKMRTSYPKISIVIPVANDHLIVRCIKSVDMGDAEIVVVLNGASLEFDQYIQNLQERDKRIVIYRLPYRGIGAARELGCQKAKGEYLIMMDSDCEFEQDCIKKLVTGLKNVDFSKGDVIYRANSFETKLVAKARGTHSSSVQNVYTPLLAFKKSVIDKIGGYYFSTKIPWTEDHELAQRVVRRNLRVAVIASAIGYHKPTTIKNDLSSAFNYGIGYNIGIRSNLTRPSFLYGGAHSLIASLFYDLYRTTRIPHYIKSISQEFGILTALYMTLWMCVFSFGYYLGYLEGGGKQ